MEQDCDLNDSKKGPFSVPEEDVSSTKNKKSFSDGQRRMENVENAFTSLQSKETPRKSNNSPFLGLAAGSENVSLSSHGDITSPRAMSMESMRGDEVYCQETSYMEQGQLVIAGLFCMLTPPRQKVTNMASNYSIEEMLGHKRALVASGGPYLNRDGTFKEYNFYQKLDSGTTIYGATESIYNLEKGDLLGVTMDVFKSKCEQFILKKRKYCKRRLNNWKQLPHCDNLMPLSGVLMADSGNIYEVTKRMHYDLQQARNQVTLIQLTSRQTNEQWRCTKRNLMYIVRSIFKGVIHLNNNKYQHYDLKEENIFASKPCGCQCSSILECTCSEDWDIKIGDLDTLAMMDRPKTWKCGTRFYRPPEGEGENFDPRYEKPTYDSWSILVIILHFCCGTARGAWNKQVKDLPWLRKNQECLYAYDRFKVLCEASTTNAQLLPFVQFSSKCLQLDHRKRSTPEKMLGMWNALCV